MLNQLWVSCCNVYMELSLLIWQEICSKINQDEDMTILKCKTICKLIKNRAWVLWQEPWAVWKTENQSYFGQTRHKRIKLFYSFTTNKHKNETHSDSTDYHWEWDWTNVWKFTKVQFAKNKTLSITWRYPFSDIRHLLLKAYFRFSIFQTKHIQL